LPQEESGCFFRTRQGSAESTSRNIAGAFQVFALSYRVCVCQDKNAANLNEKVQHPSEPQPSKNEREKVNEAYRKQTSFPEAL
jgi:hypothetical protein